MLSSLRFESPTQPIIVQPSFTGLPGSSENGVPVAVVPISIYEDPSGRRIVSIESDHEPAPPATSPSATARRTYTVDGRLVTVVDLLDVGLLEPGEPVEFIRPRLGERYDATIRADGSFELADGRVFQSPSMAASNAAGMVSAAGCYSWHVPRLGGIRLRELRKQDVASHHEGAVVGDDDA